MVALKLIGVEYTMADKESTSVPYITINDVSFLKRRFVRDVETGLIMAPLEHESIDKMLTTCVRSKKDVLCPEAHSICVIETALREYFFYGRATFDERLEYFKEIVELAGLKAYIRDSTFPSFDQLLKEHKERSDQIVKSWEQGRIKVFESYPLKI